MQRTQPPSLPCMRNCFIGHCLCTQLLYHSFTEGGVSLTTNQFESAARGPSPPLTAPGNIAPRWADNVLSHPRARRPAAPLSPPTHEFPFPPSWLCSFKTLFVAKSILRSRGSSLSSFLRPLLDNNIDRFPRLIPRCTKKIIFERGERKVIAIIRWEGVGLRPHPLLFFKLN